MQIACVDIIEHSSLCKYAVWTHRFSVYNYTVWNSSILYSLCKCALRTSSILILGYAGTLGFEHSRLCKFDLLTSSILDYASTLVWALNSKLCKFALWTSSILDYSNKSCGLLAFQIIQEHVRICSADAFIQRSF